MDLPLDDVVGIGLPCGRRGLASAFVDAERPGCAVELTGWGG